MLEISTWLPAALVALVTAGAIAIFGDVARGQTEPSGPGAGNTKAAAEAPAVPGTFRVEGAQVAGRWREGSRLIEQLGSFKLTGDRITFISSDGKLRMDCLENLASERTAHIIGDSPDPLLWTVSGVITEYRGTNYLLLSQCMLKTKPTALSRP